MEGRDAAQLVAVSVCSGLLDLAVCLRCAVHRSVVEPEALWKGCRVATPAAVACGMQLCIETLIAPLQCANHEPQTTAWLYLSFKQEQPCSDSVPRGGFVWCVLQDSGGCGVGMQEATECCSKRLYLVVEAGRSRVVWSVWSAGGSLNLHWCCCAQCR